MPDAWMVRGSQRQELQEKIHRMIYKQEDKSQVWDEHREKAQAVLCREITALLLTGEISKGKPEHPYEVEARNFLVGKILPEYSRFARAPEEYKSLLSELALWLLETALREFPAGLLHVEVMSPETIFKAPSATSHVEIEDSEGWPTS